MNPSGRVPVLEVAPGRYLAESNAILWYIAGGTPLAPEDRIDRTTALQWMFFEQNSLEPYLGAAFFWLTLVKGGRELQMHALEDWMEKGYQAFSVMEKHLAAHDFFAAGHYTIADIALYGYTHLAHECDFDLDGVSGDPRLAQPRRRPARPRADGLASGRRSRSPNELHRRPGRQDRRRSSPRSRCSRDRRRGRSGRQRLVAAPVDRPDARWFRALFRRVGEDWIWYSRLAMSDAELAAIIHDPQVEVFVLKSGAEEAGLLELDFRVAGRMRAELLRPDAGVRRHAAPGAG